MRNYLFFCCLFCYYFQAKFALGQNNFISSTYISKDSCVECIVTISKRSKQKAGVAYYKVSNNSIIDIKCNKPFLEIPYIRSKNIGLGGLFMVGYPYILGNNHIRFRLSDFYCKSDNLVNKNKSFWLFYDVECISCTNLCGRAAYFTFNTYNPIKICSYGK